MLMLVKVEVGVVEVGVLLVIVLDGSPVIVTLSNSTATTLLPWSKA